MSAGAACIFLPGARQRWTVAANQKHECNQQTEKVKPLGRKCKRRLSQSPFAFRLFLMASSASSLHCA